MELLLLLTALLSALTGAAVQSRGGEAATHQVAAVAAAPRAAAAQVRAVARALPFANHPPDLRRIASPLRLFSLASATPLYATRLRE
jgi:hypothetical protein